MNTCSGNLLRILLVFIAFFHQTSSKAQCAGTDGEVTICNKETDPSLQTFDLFSVITGAIQGGVWVAENNFDSSALDEDTGILNLWDINRSGQLLFTYTNPGCDNSSATATLNLGGYPGESSQDFGDNNACQNDSNVNLFSFLDIPDGLRGPDINGIWASSDTQLSSRLNNEFFNFVGLPIGTYTFTYTVAAVDSCPSRTAIIDVELRQTPNSGVSSDLILCETDDLSAFTMLDLFSRLNGSQDTDGVWVDVNTPNTGEITSGTDFQINVQNIFNNFGTGTYVFAYTVAPDHPICEQAVTNFVLCIERQLELDATINVECTGEVTLNYDNTVLDDGIYNVNYTVTGASLGTFNGSSGNTVFNGGIAEFDLFPSLPLQESENLTIEITDIFGGVICGNTRVCQPVITVPSESFDLYVDPIITVSSTTGCALDDILITYANAIDLAFQPIQGLTNVNYTINGVPFTDEVNFQDGNGISTLPVERFNQGTNQLVFFNTNDFIHCENIERTSVLNLIPAPPNPEFAIISDERCETTSLEFSFNSPPNEFINYTSVTFDIYTIGSAPELFAPRDASTSLSNNTEGNGIDINITDRNDVSSLPDGDYIFVIRSVQNDNALCRGLSAEEIENLASQDITINLLEENQEHIFDVRLPFRIGEQDPVALSENTFEVCTLDQEVTLADLQLTAGEGVNIAVLNADGDELSSTFSITQDAVFTAVFTSTTTACDLGTENLTVTVVTQAPIPVTVPSTFCTLNTNTVADLEVSNQDITWFNAETGGEAYNTTDELDPNNEYWAEISLIGGCSSANRTQAEIRFLDQAEPPVPQTNVFCSASNPIIDDLNVESDPEGMLIWYTSQTGPAYESTTLALDTANEYWVTQTITEGCESERVQTLFTIVDDAENPIPLSNTFCTANGTIPTLEDLNYQETSISQSGTLSYFSDAEGTTLIATTTSLDTLSSPVFVQQVVAGTCFSEIVEVNFALFDIAEAPVLQPVELCAEDNPTAQDLLDLLQQQVESTLILYENETTNTTVDLTSLLTNLTTAPFASQTLVEGCESIERIAAVFTLIRPELPLVDFQQVHCLSDQPTLNDVYLGNLNILWFNENGTPLAITEPLAENTSYFAQLEIDGCLTARTPISISLINVETPQTNAILASLCGIEENTIDDLLLIEGEPRFIIPENHTLVWYDSNDVTTRTLIDDTEVLEQNVSYFAVFQVEMQGIICEGNALEITVDLTGCDENQLVIPDAFSPNNDGINDVFELQHIEFVFPDYDIEIYNRYGRQVFRGDLETGFWDGRANRSGVISSNEILPTGVYFYVINFNRSNRSPLQGQVYLKR